MAISETRSDLSTCHDNRDGARLSMAARPNHHDSSSQQLFGGPSNNTFGSNSYDNLNIIETYSNSEYTIAHKWVSGVSYAALINYLKLPSRHAISASYLDNLPSLDELNAFAELYFEKFHTLFPLLHKRTFLDERDGCLLELAIAAIGACYAGTSYARQCSECLHELVHHLLDIASISEDAQHECPEVFGRRRPGHLQQLTLLQARILNALGMFNSGNRRLAIFAREDRAILVTACIEKKMLMQNHYDCLQDVHDRGIEEGHRILQHWLEGELKCRAGYFIWVSQPLEVPSLSKPPKIYMVDARLYDGVSIQLPNAYGSFRW